MSELLLLLACLALVIAWWRIERLAAEVSRLHAQMDQLRRDMGLAPARSSEPSERVQQLAADPGKTIEAIKTYREESGADLKTAKQVVDGLRARPGGG